MARPQTQREYDPTLDYDTQDVPVARRLQLVEDPKGIDLDLTVSEGDPNTAFVCKNFRINHRKKLQIRNALQYLGLAASDFVIQTAVIHSKTSAEYVLRWTLVGVEVWNGASWIALSGPILSMGSQDHISWTTWNSFVLFSDQRTGIYKIDLSAKTYSLISGSPVCRHITTFGSRVIASNVSGLPTRIQWSVKNNSDDWVGLGSGFEDLLSSPVGVDVQYGVFPVDDVQAIILRSGSVWIMETTGYFDTPFAFKYRYAVQCDSPWSAEMTTLGLFFLGRNNAYLVNTQQLSELANDVKDGWANYDLTLAQGCYDSWREEYYIYIPTTTNATADFGTGDAPPPPPPPGTSGYQSPSTVWVYSTLHQLWTTFEYSLPVASISAPNFRVTTTIDNLIGSIDSLGGSMDSLGTSYPVRGLMMTYYKSGAGRVLVESKTAITEPADGFTTNVTAVLQSGRILPADPLSKLRIHEVQWIVENGVGTDYSTTFRYSSDNFIGADTGSYGGTQAVSRAAIKKDVRSCKTELVREQIQLELSITGCPGLVLIGLYPVVSDDARIRL